jgi:peptidoglycan/LPS O-acetylase OafA/YrhL
VFFVVSGFVITQLLVTELEQTGRIDLRSFYVRRIRRLLPALALTTVGTLALSVLLLSPNGPQQWAARTAGAATLFASNLFLYARSPGYFAPSEETNPFLHMWSLSVEEQFYLVLPGLLLVSWLVGRRVAPRAGGRVVLAAVVGAASTISLVASWYLSGGRAVPGLPAPDRFAFYGSPPRVWEFGAGVLLALGLPLVQRWSRSTAMVVAIAGALLVGWAACTFDSTTVFPGLAAALPVGGTVLLLAAGTASDRVAGLLGRRPLTTIGDLSYGWYLWHWPAIVLTRATWPDNDVLPVLAAAASFGVAALSYRLLEQPIRRRHSLVGARALGLAGLCIALPLALAVGTAVGARSQWGLTEPIGLRPRDEPMAVRAGCVIESLDTTPEWSAQDCLVRTPGSTGTLLVLGDSHAGSISDAAITAGGRLGLDVAVWARGSCPLVDRAAPGYDACRRWHGQVLDLVDRLRPAAVVIANRSPSYVRAEGAQSPLGPIADASGRLTATADEALATWGQGLDEVLQALDARGVPVVLMSTVPEYPSGTFGGVTLLRPHRTPPEMSLEQVAARRGAVVEVERQVAERHPQVAVLDPVPWLCHDGCRAANADGVWLYRDNHHLNAYGSALLASPLADAVSAVTGR